VATVWTEEDFAELSWHDNAVHAIRIVEGIHGSGEFILDLDYIVEWICGLDQKFQFRIAPAELRFHETTNLRVALDYAASSAALTPFAIQEIRRESTSVGAGYETCRWTVELAWPSGEISFLAPRFTQRLLAMPVLSTEQYLSEEQRGRGVSGS